MKALAGHPNLAGNYLRNNKDFIYRASNAAAHNGYQTWHRVIDRELVDWIETRLTAGPGDFLATIREIYSRPEISARIPGVHIPGTGP